MPDEKLPELTQDITVDASKGIKGLDDFKAKTSEMADHAESEGKRGGAGFLGLVGGLGLAGLAAGATAKAMEGLHKVIETGMERAKDDELINSQLAAGIQSTGDAAGVSVKGMDDLAESIARMSGQTADSIGKTESLLLTFTNIKNVGPNKIFDETTLAAANMAARLGGDASQSAIQLGKALDDPIKGVTALQRVGVSFTDAQKAQIKAMVDSGNTVGAQKIILAELNKEFGNSAKAAGETLPGALARAKESFEQMSGKVVGSFLPVITDVATKLVNAFQGAAPFIEKFADFLAESLGKLGPILAPIGNAVMSTFKSFQPVLQDAMKGFDQLGPVFAKLLPPILQLATALSPTMIILKAIEPVIPTLVGAVVTLAQSLGTALTDALNAVTPILTMLTGILSGVLGQVIVALVPIVTQLAQVVGQVLVEAVQAIAPLLTMLGQFLGEILKAIVPLIPPILSLVQAFVPLIAPIVQLVGTLLQPLVQLLTVLLQPILQLVTGLVQMLVPALQMVVQWFVQYITPVIQAAQVVLQGLSDFLTGVFTGNWSKAWTGIQEIFSGVWDGIKSVVEGAVNGIIDLVNGMIGGIDQGLGAIKNLTGGAVNLSIPKIPHLSFDVGGDVPGLTGAPLSATVHGGESVVSNAMHAGTQQIPPRVVDAVHRQDARNGGTSGTTQIFNVDVTQTNPSDEHLAQTLGFLIGVNGG